MNDGHDDHETTAQRKMQFLYALRSKGVTDKLVLGAMEAVDRGPFIRGIFAERAYEDMPLPIACGQTISQPSVVGLMTQALEVSPRDKVLEIGTGSGYQAAVLAEIVDEVYETVNDRNKLIKTLAIAKSAIRHNMAKDLPKIQVPTCIIWGKNDTVTPPEVAEEFHTLLPDSDLFWIDKCGHAAMMEHPEEFNEILEGWLKQRNF